MPLSGGEADKVGNNYETLWTVRCMLRILAEEIRSITLEPLGKDGEGVEFYLIREDRVREFHQVKRQRTGGWNLAGLSSANVLQNFHSHLTNDLNSICVFVSQDEPQDLRELWERSLLSPTAQDFENHYLKTPEYNGKFANLRRYWSNPTLEETFNLLRRISIEGSAETTLNQEVRYRAESLVDGKPKLVVAALWQLAINSIRKTLDATAIWSYLEHPDRGFTRRVWNNDPHLLTRLEEANKNYLSKIRSLDILGEPIMRTEASEALRILKEEHSKHGVMLTGNAGAGKTGVAAEIIERAMTDGWLVLAFRMDRLEPVPTARKLGEQLDLPDSPVTVLGQVAGDRPSLLVIDQLDAVSTTSGRNPIFFERVEELIRQSALYPKMRLMLSCREFDLQNDDRLRRLTDDKLGIARPVTVGLLSEETVRQIVWSCSVDPSRLTPQQIAFLATPLHLKLFTEVGAPLTFETLKDLYDAYWDTKREIVKQRLGHLPQWIPLLDTLLARMVADQSLSAPKSLVADAYPEELDSLLTEHMLTLDGKRLSFFHETFFDYVFARRFVAGEKRLVPFLLGQEQHLFLRGIVRQVLTHERSDDFASYLSDLRELLERDEVRFHLKRLVFQWLRSLAHPTAEEWEIVQSLYHCKDQDVARWSQTVINGSGWFSFLWKTGWIEEELQSSDERRSIRVINYLGSNVQEFPEEVGEVILRWANLPEPWPTYAEKILSYADFDKSKLFLDLYFKLRQIGNFPLFESPFSSISDIYNFYDLPEKQPEWAIEILSEWLISLINERYNQGQTNPFGDLNGDFGYPMNGMDDRLDLMVSNAPSLFVERMLPILLELVRRNALRYGNFPWEDSIWPYHYINSHYNLHEQLIEAVVNGLRHLALHDPDAFRSHEELLWQYLEFETAGWILARAYAANGKLFAEASVKFLTSSDAWLGLGWTDSSDWVSRELIEAISPHCDTQQLESLEKTLLSYYSEWERRNPRYLGWAQLTLLNGIISERRSASVRRRLGELQRKFKVLDGSPPEGIRSGYVGAPFSANWEKMSDTQWLRAITKYDSERNHHHQFLRGGAEQLARVLQKQTKAEPVRFLRLLLRIPPEANVLYFQYILLGVGEAQKIDSDLELLWSALRYCHMLPNRPCGREISSALRTYYENDFPRDILELIAWYATEDPNPAEEIWQPRNERNIYSGGDASSASLNSVRGAMAWPIANLLFEHETYFEFFEPILKKMVADPSIAVRTQVAYALLPILNIDRNLAMALFLQLCEVTHPDLLKARYIVKFLNYAIWTHLEETRPVIDQMLSSSDSQVVQKGASLACIACLIYPENDELSATCLACLSGPQYMRLGVAEIAAKQLQVVNDRDWCERVLQHLFNDEDDKIRRVAASCFHKIQGDELLALGTLVNSFIESKAFQGESSMFFKALNNATVPLPDILCSAFEKSVSLMRNVNVGEVVGTGRFADREAHLLVRLYERTSEPAIKQRCLNVIDGLARTEAAYDLERTLAVRDMV